MSTIAHHCPLCNGVWYTSAQPLAAPATTTGEAAHDYEARGIIATTIELGQASCGARAANHNELAADVLSTLARLGLFVMRATPPAAPAAVTVKLHDDGDYYAHIGGVCFHLGWDKPDTPRGRALAAAASSPAQT